MQAEIEVQEKIRAESSGKLASLNVLRSRIKEKCPTTDQTEEREKKVALKKLMIVTTDLGANGDDQKAVLGLIEELGEGEELAFIVSGPHPKLAAAVIAQKYHQKTGNYPLIATGKQFEAHLIPEDRIYSLVDGKPIKESSSTMGIITILLEDFESSQKSGADLLVNLGQKRSDESSSADLPPNTEKMQNFHKEIDKKIISGTIEHFTQIVLAPLHNDNEYYNTSREELKNNASFAENWKKIKKYSITQFQYSENEGIFKGNNYSKSNPAVANHYLFHLQKQQFQRVFFDGAVAKFPEFLLAMKQPEQPGIQSTAKSYIINMQVPWLSMTEPVGVTPSEENMHVGMFTPSAQVPFGVHVSGKNPAGFGAQRLMKEVCGIPPEETEKYEAMMQPIHRELDRFDEQVQIKAQKDDPTVDSVLKTRNILYTAMMNTLQQFSKEQGIINDTESVGSFKELFERADACNKSLNAYTYMKRFKEILFEISPPTQKITAIAHDERNKKREGNSLSHVEIMANAIGDKASVVVYDAVATVAGRLVHENPALHQYFTDTTEKFFNITPANMQRLQTANLSLYLKFVQEIRNGLTKDGCLLALAEAK